MAHTPNASESDANRFQRLVADIANIEAGKTVVMAYHGMFREKSASDNQKSQNKNLSVAAAGDRFAKAANAASKQDADKNDKNGKSGNSGNIYNDGNAQPSGGLTSDNTSLRVSSSMVCFGRYSRRVGW